jgi:hypothetical protein
MSNFQAIQRRFFERIARCCNPSEVTIQFVKITSSGALADFTGDSVRTLDKEVKLRCFYQRYLNDKQREKAGVMEDVQLSIFVSPLELEAKNGSFDFPEAVRSSYSGIAIQFLGKHHEIESIRDLEPQQLQGKVTCVAYQINLKAGKGNTDFN